MRCLALGTILSCLLSGPVIAACSDEQKLGQITYANNSSYFSPADSRDLEQIKQQASDKKQGYLLLEFNLFPSADDKKLQQYNLWLANRRIERVKNYLSAANLPLPIITRIRTAAPEERRDVDILWCPSSTLATNEGTEKR
ncbi:hypothetical protein [Shewanella dokdonensis]|uniref:OmpA-like domain-containing protein n=1 Tax=Shewanella dokdonensis TaxID=712036 RepID=A0ABX8DC94_9GAMM|nr:hypothetical protein [Shewanella dokdonensis]MCL1074620.1 hypothetical protein [Shewanella dokdonensis]QVK22375.1 hypothetical protein KHX94_13385 [Shewanella dokdonensis]